MSGDINSLVNTLIWVLVLIAIIAAVVAVIRALSRPRGHTVVEQAPVARQEPAPAASGGLSPGWYPDQQDPSLMRYYDGRVWTAQTQPHR